MVGEAITQTPSETLSWKRPLDLVTGAALLLASFPLWIIIALLIKLGSRGPVFYTQEAIGRGGEPFRLYKFRTMRTDADNERHRAYIATFVDGKSAQDEDGGERKVYKMVDDDRVTRVGRWLRRLSVDELPQLLNVLRGEMSLVGPRPPLPYEFALYDDWARQRLAVQPGITGLYQVTLRSEASFREMVEVDLEYIRRRSLWLDLGIMARTAPVMLLGKGGY
ncbi:MAG: sugar transferase [Chloroflexi bacterium]|nr:sugar transferase [Chloroflexota bacterium]